MLNSFGSYVTLLRFNVATKYVNVIGILAFKCDPRPCAQMQISSVGGRKAKKEWTKVD